MADSEKKLYDLAYRLAILGIILSFTEGAFSVYYGYNSSSVTLLGNGIASFIAVISGFGILGMTKRIRRNSAENLNMHERMALRITEGGLYLLSGGLLAVGVLNIFRREHPSTTV